MRTLKLASIAAVFAGTAAFAGETPSADGAQVYFINLSDGAAVTAPVTVQFGLKGMGVAPAGTEAEFTGHHHLLINRPPLGEGEDGNDEFEYGLPSDENHLHFGKGQTEATIDLPAGKHTLQLVLADWGHVPHDKPVVSDVITIFVE